MKTLAIDYGDARTGIAVSDLTGSIVGSTAVIHSRNRARMIEEIVGMVRQAQAGEVVMGFPRNMDGSEGPRAELYRSFADDLSKALGMEVHLWDERRTTVEAHNILSAHNYHGAPWSKACGPTRWLPPPSRRRRRIRTFTTPSRRPAEPPRPRPVNSDRR